MPKNTTFFTNKLIVWYLENKRSLPWRETKDPYAIWLSEIILQQTRVAQGLPYYLSFIKTYPTVYQLANAPEEKVLKLWQGLGYYSRARNLHATAKYIANQCNGIFPSTYKDLLNLRGVGDYTASAIASICFNEAAAVVDGNVYRVLSRVFGIETPINSSQGIKEFKTLAQLLLDTKQPGTYNQAVMEFGANHCKPQRPDCVSCVLSEICLAFKNQKVFELPVKLKKTKIKKHYFNYIVPISKDNKTVLEQRIQKGIWQNLYQFPLVESEKVITQKELESLPAFMELSESLGITQVVKFNEEVITHKLSHKHLQTVFWVAEVSELKNKGVSFNDVVNYAVPILIGNFISKFPSFNP